MNDDEYECEICDDWEKSKRYISIDGLYKYAKQADEYNDLDWKITKAKKPIEDIYDHVAPDVPAKKSSGSDLTARKIKLDAREAELDKREKALDAREASLKKALLAVDKKDKELKERERIVKVKEDAFADAERIAAALDQSSDI